MKNSLRPLPRDVTSPHPHPTLGKCGLLAYLGCGRIVFSYQKHGVEWRRFNAYTDNTEESEENPRSGLSVRCIATGRWAALWVFLCVHLSVFLGRWTQYLCDVTSVTQSKIFCAFRIFQKKLEPVKLATKFLGKESWSWLILFHERLKRPWFEGLKVFLCSPARCVLCRRNLSVRAPRGPSDLKRSREFDQWCVLSRFHSQTYC